MILGVGIDLVEVARIGHSISEFGDKFTRRLFTQGERTYSEGKANANERFAARFAAKEAAMKALGTGLSAGISWTEIEVGNNEAGKPFLQLHGVAGRLAREMGVKRMSLSLTHTSQSASAIVILED